MTTRLDRLFLLLETGSTPVIRKSAAGQLGEVQRLHPHEFLNLLTKVHEYLISSNWDTRIAASQAIEAIAKHVPAWDPVPNCKKEDEDASSCSSSIMAGQLEFSQFDVGKVLSQAESLLASEGAEFDVPTDMAFANQREYLARQKQLLNKRLGLDIAGGLGMSSDDFYQEDDLVIDQQQMSNNNKSSLRECVQSQAHGAAQGDLSARERNLAKRRAKQFARRSSRDVEKASNGNGEGSDSEPVVKKRKTASVVTDQPCQDNKVAVDSVPDNTLDQDQQHEWPFEWFCDLLINNLFNPSWEHRHGAALGMREILKLHSAGAGKCAGTTVSQMESDHQHWLEDIALRLICVLALDRFGDFVSDEVVAPVRETCAQALGLVVRSFAPEGVQNCGRVLLQLLSQPQWEVRHGGLLGIKYLLAVRQDLVKTLIPLLVPSVFQSLQDKDDDVRAVAAAALLPITDALITDLTDKIPDIVKCLWFTLLDLDDLTASTGSIMSLLASVLAHSDVSPQKVCGQSLTELVPRLWPFLRHNISSVRMSAVQTLYTLLEQHKDEYAEWIIPILPDTMRHLYQRCLLEQKQDILDMITKVWSSVLRHCSVESIVAAVCPWLGSWLCLLMQPMSLPFDNQLLIDASHQPKELTPSRLRHAEHQTNKASIEHKEYVGGHQSFNQPPHRRDQTVVRARITASRMLGELCTYFCRPLTSYPEGMETPLESLSRLFCFHLNSMSALQRISIALVVYQWALYEQQSCQCPEVVRDKLLECLSDSIYYDEIALAFARLQTEARNLQASLKQQGADVSQQIPAGTVLTLEQIQSLSTTVFESVKSKLKPRCVKEMEDRCKELATSVALTMVEQQGLTTRVQCCLAASVVHLQKLPEKLNPVIRPIMEALKKEENSQIQTVAGNSLSQLLLLCMKREPSPNAKVIKNLCSMLCADSNHTPLVNLDAAASSSTATDVAATHCDKYSGIITLNAQLKINEKVVRGRGAAKRLAAVAASGAISSDVSMEAVMMEEDEGRKQLLVQRRGATLALTIAAVHAGANLPSNLAQLWDALLSVISTLTGTDLSGLKNQDDKAQEMVNSLQVMETVSPSLHEDLLQKVLGELERLCNCLQHPYTAVRHMAARCIGMLGKMDTGQTMNIALEVLLPLLAAPDTEVKRQGAIEALTNMIEQLGMDLIPYIVLLVVPVLGRMSDQNEQVRLMATHCFATLIKLMPLEAGSTVPPDMKPSLVERKEQQREFLEQLLDNSKVTNYAVPVPVKADLRKYQQDGVNWLAFLSKYHLHGILCDDMGLGKTLQSICMMAGDHHLCKIKYEETGADDCIPLPSLVICPPTLTGHWVYEIEKFVSSEFLNPLHYTGPPSERVRLQKFVKKHNLVVASYDVVRNDIDFFGKKKWNYCVLDEGHIIKNSKTKLFKAVKQLQVNHRLILSGTPIQNNVLELWSLFDFLMPGYLGTERQFQARYGKPILQSRDAKSSSKEQEAGALAMESLHRQLLPFVLRRMKEDVLKDLPPKIVQDYYCDLSPLQVRLYEDFAKSRAKRSVEDTITHGSPEKESKNKQHQHVTHIFQALQYLRKVCNHPALVLTNQHPQYEEVSKELKSQNSNIRDLLHAPKLTALKQLLQDCGIGVTDSGSDSSIPQPVVNQHRVLLFCQLKGMLDIVENDLLKMQMPSVTYLRLDGSVPAGSRHGVVSRFNDDPSIDILLLTTHVGGLGLNLTGADTVIFVEHDWNPMKDLQAMDRAHRIGQKKVVNVYRLISRGTLEEKIMGLQKFKLNIANTVISQENASLASMGTDQLLDLFSLENKGPEKKKGQADGASQTGMKAILDNLEELWDESQYESEYDMENFMKALQK